MSSLLTHMARNEGQKLTAHYYFNLEMKEVQLLPVTQKRTFVLLPPDGHSVFRPLPQQFHFHLLSSSSVIIINLYCVPGPVLSAVQAHLVSYSDYYHPHCTARKLWLTEVKLPVHSHQLISERAGFGHKQCRSKARASNLHVLRLPSACPLLHSSKDATCRDRKPQKCHEQGKRRRQGWVPPRSHC